MTVSDYFLVYFFGIVPMLLIQSFSTEGKNWWGLYREKNKLQLIYKKLISIRDITICISIFILSFIYIFAAVVFIFINPAYTLVMLIIPMIIVWVYALFN